MKKEFKDKIDDWNNFYDSNGVSGRWSFTSDWPYDENGLEYEVALHKYESTGVKHSCNNILKLEKVLHGKHQLAIQIDTWADSMAKDLLREKELICYCDELGLGKWVVKAVLTLSPHKLGELY